VARLKERRGGGKGSRPKNVGKRKGQGRNSVNGGKWSTAAEDLKSQEKKSESWKKRWGKCFGGDWDIQPKRAADQRNHNKGREFLVVKRRATGRLTKRKALKKLGGGSNEKVRAGDLGKKSIT